MSNIHRKSILYFAALALAIIFLYGQSMGNALLFDDKRLSDGSLFWEYRELLTLKLRALSYGSFVWVKSIAGDNWALQRWINVALHLATVWMVYQFLTQLLNRTEFSDEVREAADFEVSKQSALKIGLFVFALNPVAVYAVAYLVQRSIVMATLFGVMACWAFVRYLEAQRLVWAGLALLSYVCAVLSKEHAVGIVLMAVPLYVFFRRPAKKQILSLGIVIAVLLAVGMALLWTTLGKVFGIVFDEVSRAHAAQLEALVPGVSSKLYLLSILNQAAQFFHYGLLWTLPFVGWMSIDMHPEFPTSLFAFPQILGAASYLVLFVVSAFFLAKRSNVFGLIGICLLWPCILFLSEFGTVWIQDPFVLYRSYLWAVTLPALFALVFMGLPRKFSVPIGLLLACLLIAFSFERIQSLKTPLSAWSDAAEKIDLKAKPNALGRWRPFQNLGGEHLARENREAAMQAFKQAVFLNEPLGSAHFSIGMLLQQSGQNQLALAEFDSAEKQGFTELAMYYHRAEAFLSLGRYADARRNFELAIAGNRDTEFVNYAKLRRGETSLAAQDWDTAIAEFKALLIEKPDTGRYMAGLGMAYLGKKDFQEALRIFDSVLAKKPAPQVYFSRALVYFKQGDFAASSKDLAIALKAEPGNPAFQNLQQQLSNSTPVTKKR